MQMLATELRWKTSGGGLLSDAALPTPIAKYLQVLADVWAVAATRWPSLAVTDHGTCNPALTAYANAMTTNFESVGEGVVSKGFGKL